MRYSLLFTFIILSFSLNSSAKTNLNLAIDTLKKGKNYTIFSKTDQISSIDITKKKKAKQNEIYIYFGYPTTMPASNAIKGNVIGGKMGENRDNLPLFDKIEILNGKYEDIKVSPDTKYRNLFTLTGLEFPLRLKLKSGLETIDFELLEVGEWNIDIELKNN